MDTSTKNQSPLLRQLASLKLLSRLISHELHAAGGSKTIQLSREEVQEIQTTIDLFIEDVQRRQGNVAQPSSSEPQLISSRN
jgi:hypothetical protein